MIGFGCTTKGRRKSVKAMKTNDEEPYGTEEAQRRFEAALRGSVKAGPHPMRDVPRKRPESKGGKKPAKASS